jgi:hypothetical protein
MKTLVHRLRVYINMSKHQRSKGIVFGTDLLSAVEKAKAVRSCRFIADGPDNVRLPQLEWFWVSRLIYACRNAAGAADETLLSSMRDNFSSSRFTHRETINNLTLGVLPEFPWIELHSFAKECKNATDNAHLDWRVNTKTSRNFALTANISIEFVPQLINITLQDVLWGQEMIVSEERYFDIAHGADPNMVLRSMAVEMRLLDVVSNTKDRTLLASAHEVFGILGTTIDAQVALNQISQRAYSQYFDLYVYLYTEQLQLIQSPPSTVYQLGIIEDILNANSGIPSSSTSIGQEMETSEYGGLGD